VITKMEDDRGVMWNVGYSIDSQDSTPRCRRPRAFPRPPFQGQSSSTKYDAPNSESESSQPLPPIQAFITMFLDLNNRGDAMISVATL
jgi:hypothetical protein